MMPVAVAGSPAKNQTTAREDGVVSANSGGKGGPTTPSAPGKPSAPAWSKPDELKYVPTNLMLLRRECKNGKAVMSRVPVSMNLLPVPPLVPRFDDSAVGITEGEIGRRKARELGFASTPSYYAVGGLVWSVLSQPLINAVGEKVPHATSLCMYRWKRAGNTLDGPLGDCGTETDQVVILLRGLDHKVNENYGKNLIRVLRFINAEPVVSLKGLIGQVAQAFQSKTPYLTFTFAALEDGEDVSGNGEDPDVVLDTAAVLKTEASGEILSAYGLQSPVSEDLAEDYKKAMSALASLAQF